LLKAVPAYAASVADLGGIPGRFPDLREEVPACRFAGRCDRAVARCPVETPAIAGPEAEGRVACWNPLP
jgi:oligopeptide/dipeptide ABC transporter ATP-binding protein